MSVVKVRNLRKRFGTLEVLSDVSFSVERGTVVAVIGRSGSGKSTMLRCINGLEKLSDGEIEVAGFRLTASGESLRQLRLHVGMVFQSYNLFPHYTAEQNITLALRVVKKLPAAAAAQIATEVLQKVGLLDKRRSYPSELSGGQQQRVAIARSLAMHPDVILFDEVTSALDPELTEEVLNVIIDLAKSGMTMILVTHEMSFALNVADTVIFMHQGKVWEQGPPKEVLRAPQTKELQQFLKFAS